MRRLYRAALVFAVSVTTGVAQETGEAVLTLDGVEYAARLDPNQSDWSGSFPSGSASIRFQGVDRGRVAEFGSLMVGFEFNGTSATNPEVDLVRLPQGKLERLCARKDAARGALRVEITGISAKGSDLVMTGTVTGKLGTSGDFCRSIDLSNPVSFKVTFSATIR